MRKLLYLLVVFAILALTNPQPDRHRQEIDTAFKTQKPLLGSVGGGKLLSAFAQYQNYYIGSATFVDGQWVSFGALGMVKVRDMEKLSQRY